MTLQQRVEELTMTYGNSSKKVIGEFILRKKGHLNEYTIQEIADIVGYGDALYFGRLFKREMGMTPSQYRKQYQTT